MAITASLYNSIGFIDDQKSWSRTIQNKLSDIAQIYILHQAHHDFNLALLHRHHSLDSEHAMVHHWDDKRNDICEIKRTAEEQLSPCAYFLADDRFLPYEYSVHSQPRPDEAFLSQLGAYLRDHGLESSLAVVSNICGEHTYVERMAPDLQGTISSKLAGSAILPHAGWTVTQWSFHETSQSIIVRPAWICDDTAPTGGHDRKPPPKPEQHLPLQS